MKKSSEHSKFAVMTVVLGMLLLVIGGCSSASNRMYMTTLRNYPGCIDQAQINRGKANACMYSTDRASFNSCLASQGVPQVKIDNLNACVEARRNRTIGNLFY